jgi:predicted NAD/FAD-binding protein
MAAAYYLSRRHEVTLFEQENRLGGHTNTFVVESSQGPLPVDTGFIVHNRVTYPNFCRLIDQLGIATQPSDMSFAVTDRRSYEYSSRGLTGYFAQSSNLLRPRHYRLLAEIMRFNREATGFLEKGEAGATLGGILRARHYSRNFIENYLYPTAAAVWSMPPRSMDDFPALTLLRFFQNHGLLAIRKHPRWYTITGGSHTYIPKVTAPYRERIHLGAKISSISRVKDGVTIDIHGNDTLTFDEVVFACHGDEVLPMLADPTERERDVLGSFRNTSNRACLHTDSRMLPKRKRARASWNYLLGEPGNVTLTYHMNRLQSLPVPEDYCVTLNREEAVSPGRMIARINYRHPVYDAAAVRAQSRWPEISGHNHTHFCGAYWFYGFHEDGVRSALRVAAALGVKP